MSDRSVVHGLREALVILDGKPLSEKEAARVATLRALAEQDPSPREPDPWPIIEWLAENMPRALELCPYKVNGIGSAERPYPAGSSGCSFRPFS